MYRTILMLVFLGFGAYTYSTETGDINIGIFPCTNCVNNNCSTQTGECFGACLDGFYGSNCNLSCSDHGTCHKSCNKSTGECDCPPACNICYQHYCYSCHNITKFGPYCNKTCPSYCKGGCTIYGSCKYGCVDGLWDPDCNYTCDKDCKICDRKNGTCTVCKDGLAGVYCDHQCPANCKDNKCDRKAGFCVRCEDGWYGELCDNRCSPNCVTCGDNTTCIDCKDGYSGLRCDQHCLTGCTACTKGDNQICNLCENSTQTYGPTCQCSTLECNFTDPNTYSCAQCLDAQTHYPSGKGCCRYTQQERHCKNSSTNNNAACVEGCEIGYYGKFCDNKCSKNCRYEYYCNDITGFCFQGCKNGWLHLKCDFNCSDNIAHCAECSDNNKVVTCKRCENGFSLSVDGTCLPCNHCLDKSCNSVTGECLKGCVPGYYVTSNNFTCQRCYLSCYFQQCYSDGDRPICFKCPEQYYGPRCDKVCSANCFNNTCHQIHGYCTEGCKDGYMGPYCLYSCNRCEEGACNSSQQTCSKCKQGYYGNECQHYCDACIDSKCTSDGTCQNGCIPGRYGDKCQHFCYFSHCFACDQYNGDCKVCMDNYTGSRCYTPCPTCINPFTNHTQKGCSPGKHGPNCEETCNRNCGLETSNDTLGICDRFTGDCLDGCLHGYYGDNCNTSCGNCNFTTNVSCDINTGNCPGDCMTGFFSAKCDKNCPKGCKDLYCDREHGLCDHGCNGTYSGPKCDKIVSPPPADKSSGLSVGAIVGICVAVIVVLFGIMFGLVHYIRFKRNPNSLLNAVSEE